MKINLYKLFIPFLLANVLVISSCKDGLKEELVSNVSGASFYNNPAGFESLITACYGSLRDWYGQEKGFAMTEYGVDTYTEGPDGDNKQYNRYNATLNPDNGYVSSTWSGFYQGINTCNAAVDRADGIPGLALAQKNKRLGEARFLRALYYFLLVQIYGDIPLNIHEINSVQTEVIRADQKRIYEEVILPDLRFAIANLPATQSDYGRVTQAAAKGLQSRVDLVLGNWPQAEAMAKSVISDYNFRLADTYASIWDMNNQKNSEVIWSVQYTKDLTLNGPGNTAHMYFLMTYESSPGMIRDVANGRSFKRFRLTTYGNQLFNPTIDRRYSEGFKTTFYANNAGTLPSGMKLGDTAIYVTNQVVAANIKSAKKYKLFDLTDIVKPGSLAFLTPVKFLDPQRPDVNATQGSRDFMVMRVAEMYLNLAEAQFRQGNLNGAATNLTALRRMRAMPGRASDMVVSESQVTLDFILDERGRELYGEMQRWFDLKRTGTLISRTRLYNPEAAPNIQDYHMVRPIPQSEIDRASNILPQNLGYR